MKKRFYFGIDDVNLDPPCREMEKIYVSYTESTNPEQDPKTTQDPPRPPVEMSWSNWSKKGYFWLSVTMFDDDFKEISETRY